LQRLQKQPWQHQGQQPLHLTQFPGVGITASADAELSIDAKTALISAPFPPQVPVLQKHYL